MNKPRLTTALTPELTCRDIAVSLAFYTKVLGFSVQYQREEEGFAMLERQGSRIMLDLLRNKVITGTDRNWSGGPLEFPFGRGVNFQIETTNVEDLYQSVLRAKATIYLPMEEMWYQMNDEFTGNKQFIVLDPDGYLLRFFQDLGTRSTRPYVS